MKNRLGKYSKDFGSVPKSVGNGGNTNMNASAVAAEHKYGKLGVVKKGVTAQGDGALAVKKDPTKHR